MYDKTLINIKATETLPFTLFAVGMEVAEANDDVKVWHIYVALLNLDFGNRRVSGKWLKMETI